VGVRRRPEGREVDRECAMAGNHAGRVRVAEPGLDPDARHAVLHVADATTTASGRDLNDHLRLLRFSAPRAPSDAMTKSSVGGSGTSGGGGENVYVRNSPPNPIHRRELG